MDPPKKNTNQVKRNDGPLHLYIGHQFRPTALYDLLRTFLTALLVCFSGMGEDSKGITLNTRVIPVRTTTVVGKGSQPVAKG